MRMRPTAAASLPLRTFERSSWNAIESFSMRTARSRTFQADLSDRRAGLPGLGYDPAVDEALERLRPLGVQLTGLPAAARRTSHRLEVVAMLNLVVGRPATGDGHVPGSPRRAIMGLASRDPLAPQGPPAAPKGQPPCRYSAVTMLWMPPRVENRPVTVIRRGRQAATRSSRMRFTTSS